MKPQTLTTRDFLELEAATAQAKIDAIKKLIAKEERSNKNSTEVPVLVQHS